MVFNLGNYYTATYLQPRTATPTDGFCARAGDGHHDGNQFQPEASRSPTLGPATGGKLANANAQTATVDTTGLAAGSYTANSTITD